MSSPCLKLKPKSKGSKPGFQMVNVQPYGGLLAHTWFDRDLSVAGCVLVKQGEEVVHRLVSPAVLLAEAGAIHALRQVSAGCWRGWV